MAEEDPDFNKLLQKLKKNVLSLYMKKIYFPIKDHKRNYIRNLCLPIFKEMTRRGAATEIEKSRPSIANFNSIEEIAKLL